MFAPLRDVECIGDDDKFQRTDIDLLIDLEIMNYFDNVPEDEEANDRLRRLALGCGM
jgi:hypothetical protein